MDLKEALIQERHKLLREVSSIECLLRSRWNWEPTRTQEDDWALGGLYEAEMIAAGRQAAEAASSTIPYQELAEEYVAGYIGTQPFSVSDFQAWLQEKFPGREIGAGARGAFHKLHEKNLVEVIRRGAGRSPTLYQKAQNGKEGAEIL